MSGIYPAAVQRPIPPGSNDPPIVPRIAVLHVAVSNADSLHDFFDGPSGGVESHFYIRFDGTVEQYRSIYFQADAQLDANDFAVGIETAGMGSGEWTAEQLASIKALLTWLHTEAKIPLEECTAWNGEGVGYHTMWGAPSHWTPSVKTCPGPDRIKQFNDVIVPWMASRTRPPLFRIKHRIATANLYVRNRDQSGGLVRLNERVKQAFGWAPDAIGVQEGRDVSVAGYTTLVADDEGEAGREIPVLLRSGFKRLGVEFHHAADGTSSGALDHPRGIFVVKYLKRRRKVALVNTHMGVFGEPLASAGRPGPGAQEHAEHAAKVVRIVERLRRNGYVVHVTADGNSRGLWVESLPAVLAEIGMTVTRHGVDLIASDPKRVRRPVDVAIVPKAVTGSDAHDAIAIRSTERKTR